MTTEETSTSFWDRVGVSEADRLRCLDAVQARYTGWTVQELGDQGYCSLTLLIRDARERQGSDAQSSDADVHQSQARLRIVQIRPARYALDMSITRAAKDTYLSLAPFIRSLDLGITGQLCAYEMQRMNGTPLARLLPRYRVIDSALQREQERLIESFVAAVAQGLKTAQLKDRSSRADSPMEDAQSMLSRCTGKVGSSIVSRLEKLGHELPNSQLRNIARDTLAHIKTMDDYPIVLNHGDLIPSNILVDEDTWDITGLVDWAEAEYLPFGTCLYGLEHLLGYMSQTGGSSNSNDSSASTCKITQNFVYYENSSQLRELFWRRLFSLVPGLRCREDDVRMMRRLGILLWYGFAWDDGAIDRVVNDVDDPVETGCLRAFLDVE